MQAKQELAENQKANPAGIEPTTFGSEVQRANPLRYGSQVILEKRNSRTRRTAEFQHHILCKTLATCWCIDVACMQLSACEVC